MNQTAQLASETDFDPLENLNALQTAVPNNLPVKDVATAPVMPVRASRHHAGLIIGLLLALLGIGAGVVLAATQFDVKFPGSKELSALWDKIWQRETPTEVMQKMAATWPEIKTGELRGNVYLAKLDGRDYNITVTFDGAFDVAATASQKFDYNLNVYQKTEGKEDVNLVGGNFRYAEQTLYFKLNELPKNPMLDFSPFLDKWFFIDMASAQDLKQFSGGANTANAPSTADVQEVENLFEQYSLYQFDQALPLDDLDGIKAYHYRLKLDKKNLLTIVQKIQAIAEEKYQSQGVPFTYPKEYEQRLAEILSKVDVFGDLWIEQESYYLRRVQVYAYLIDASAKTSGAQTKSTFPHQLFAVESAQATPPVEGREPIFTLVFAINKINQPVKIVKPESAESFAEVIKELFGGWLQQMPLLEQGADAGVPLPEPGITPISPGATPTQNLPEATGTFNLDLTPVETPIDLTKDSDGDGLTDQDELRYGTAPENPDTDVDGYSDGDEVKNGYNPRGPGRLGASEDPESAIVRVFELFKAAAKDQNQEFYLMQITADSKTTLAGGTISAAQFSNEYQSIKDLMYTTNYAVMGDEGWAEINFSPQNDYSPPYLLTLENGEWKIDLKRMSETYVFDTNNKWSYK
ncbi:MAG: hypothetical protein A2445_05795 [Candidatus Jacksonbacteria bacterium RIFOXYC2_FULL_44_29]|nr:MAG: OmpA domain-containing protein [Parcubacteria group bacterium GW2011_GWC2_44_22]OGY76022.1 MAG: hypothetical protein A2240_05640 [Candidatus Jacksonbacteria bacterium RIFOXYA2_FULL_43_12]OGY76788.1 MAG: hypothetical protein A2295_00440 [Candidatus Jacksonbacteria bacterium RIFOXYB2_FULL_44_15]OGY79195.1 MAG: hypothetical protein A2445_05795 [Candidatus Jacksonbacteria bacterium RIFOXYC2_FULL_44_29]OGY82086.1 MAG: hypothetical protein A2550_00085 [Candidatus Jacksonbacteria bacterium RIF